MTTVVIMPGGFHPFHAGHAALYQSARRAFPDAEVYVAATNDTSTRPFPFAIKEKLAQLAGVEPGHFIQVKSPFQAREITSQFDPERDQLIFVRSEKDATKPPQAGGIKKDGNPAYLQPLLGAKKLEPFGRHAYMAYLPTVEFGPGMTSATEIRTAWPQLDERRKTALVMSLYPRTQGNPQLAATVVKMLDTAIVDTANEGQGWAATLESPTRGYIQEKSKSLPGVAQDPELLRAKRFARQHYGQFKKDPDVAFDKWVQRSLKHSEENDVKHDQFIRFLTRRVKDLEQQIRQSTVNEDYVEEKWSDKYKRSIDCNNPQGFSQRAHCAGRKK